MALSADVIIPVYRPGKELRNLLEMLKQQTLQPAKILLVNTEQSLFDESILDGLTQIQVVHIKKTEFDHGGTRHMAARMTDSDLILFMTQDAIPENNRLLEELAGAFSDPQVSAAYARQLPAADCSLLERYTRGFNYGSQSRLKTAKDLPELGIKTFFCSNVCAMYRRTTYEELGGFPVHTIFNEDMIFAGRLIQAGKTIAYCAKARVIHSHNYSAMQQFHRNFDLGVSQAEHPEVFNMAKSESEGIRMVKKTAVWLLQKRRPWLLPKLVLHSGCKLIGYRLGKHYKRLPRKLVLACTMNREYWKNDIV